MNIKHRTTPIEHWIVDGKAYRLAAACDIGSEVYRSDIGLEDAIKNGTIPLTNFGHEGNYPYFTTVDWKYAYIQDDSLLEDTEIEPGPTEESTPKPIDWTKPVRTKDGRAVRVVCTDAPGTHPIIGIVQGVREPFCWEITGVYEQGLELGIELENVPQRIQREYWVNVYQDDAIAYSTKLRADEVRASSCRACVKITIDCEEGEGL